jgi:hypothetical protein
MKMLRAPEQFDIVLTIVISNRLLRRSASSEILVGDDSQLHPLNDDSKLKTLPGVSRKQLTLY